jgi:hypothetical protein
MQDGDSNYGRVVQENGLQWSMVSQTGNNNSVLFVKTNNVLKEVVLKSYLFFLNKYHEKLKIHSFYYVFIFTDSYLSK